MCGSADVFYHPSLGPFTLGGITPVFLRDIARRGTLPPAVAFTSGVKLAGNGERYANEFTPTTCLGARDTTDEGSPWRIPHTRA